MLIYLVIKNFHRYFCLSYSYRFEKAYRKYQSTDKSALRFPVPAQHHEATQMTRWFVQTKTPATLAIIRKKTTSMLIIAMAVLF